jgi:uncharacterized membrane protein YciS (DUF1049 family)
MSMAIAESYFFFGPLIGMIFSLGFVALGLFVTYLIIRAAINNSRLNQNVQDLRLELRELHHQVRELKDTIERNKWQS